ncbi:Hypothetical predicted protein [Podarcis lilfordi]|uniref:Uncharacterized protein n=1 Tax=Podarcis lilfordi TaxID=74358 RepID=A0AA35K789_9SAUR|nr:Hypothetical predicted protein [Podarcis lilfordi]
MQQQNETMPCVLVAAKPPAVLALALLNHGRLGEEVLRGLKGSGGGGVESYVRGDKMAAFPCLSWSSLRSDTRKKDLEKVLAYQRVVEEPISSCLQLPALPVLKRKHRPRQIMAPFLYVCCAGHLASKSHSGVSCRNICAHFRFLEYVFYPSEGWNEAP